MDHGGGVPLSPTLFTVPPSVLCFPSSVLCLPLSVIGFIPSSGQHSTLFSFISALLCLPSSLLYFHSPVLCLSSSVTVFILGLGTEFRSEKIPRNKLGTASVIPRKKLLIPRFTEESIQKLGTEGNGMKTISFTKNPAPANRIDSVFSSENCFGTKFREVGS